MVRTISGGWHWALWANRRTSCRSPRSPASETATRFEGRDFGSSVSVFLSHHPPGKGAPLHRHPYDETFIVQAGSARFTVDGEETLVEAGHFLVVSAGAAHGFVSCGDEPLNQVSIHPSDHFVQEWLEDG